MDLNAAELSVAGCLNLQMVNERMARLPDDTVVREYTHDVGVAVGSNFPDTATAKTRFHNMESEVSLANLALKEKSSREFIAGLSAIEQTDCAQVVRTDQMGNHETFEIVKEGQSNLVHIRSADHLREETYTLIGPRHLEIKIVASHVDRCPKFTKFQVTVAKIRSWGSTSELNADPILLNRDFARNLSSAVDSTPDDILMQLGQDDGGAIRLTGDDISQLKSQSPTEAILHCPIGSTPPSSDEAPRPEQTATPSPQAAQSPTPSPAPGVATATPVPTATPPPPEPTPIPQITAVPSPMPISTPTPTPTRSWWP